MLKSLRMLCFIEGLSCIALFFIAMPVKYILGEPRLVSVVGMIHGLLWSALIFAFVVELTRKTLSYPDALRLLVVSTFPLGMFWVDRRIQNLEKDLLS